MPEEGRPSPPHSSSSNPERHVDIQSPTGNKLHVPVQNELGATAIGAAARKEAREEKGRG